MVRIHCGHPRLRPDRRAVAAAIRLLDAHATEIVNPPVSPVQSEIVNRKSKIPVVPAGELSIAFLTDAALARLHAAFLKNPAPTDVITFPGAPGAGGCISKLSANVARVFRPVNRHDTGRETRATSLCWPAERHRQLSDAPGSGQAGEICVSVDAARAFAKKHGRDFSAELTLYLVHGWLHLAGHDDLDPAKKGLMRAAEARAMARLKRYRVIPRFSWKIRTSRQG